MSKKGGVTTTFVTSNLNYLNAISLKKIYLYYTTALYFYIIYLQ